MRRRISAERRVRGLDRDRGDVDDDRRIGGDVDHREDGFRLGFGAGGAEATSCAARRASRRSAAFCRSSASSAISAISDQASSEALSSCRLRRSAARALAYWPASISALACRRCVCASCFSASISVARALSLAGLMRRTCLISATCSSGDSASAARRSQVTSWVGSSRTISAKCWRAAPMFLSRTAAMPCSVSWLITWTRARPASVLARVSVGLSAQARSRYASRSTGSPARAAQASHTSGDDGAWRIACCRSSCASSRRLANAAAAACARMRLIGVASDTSVGCCRSGMVVLGSWRRAPENVGCPA